MYELRDTFNDRTISRHRTILAAMKASRRHDARLARSNGATSYVPKKIMLNGEPISCRDYLDAVDELDRIGFVTRPQC